jgi:hypothetical protein
VRKTLVIAVLAAVLVPVAAAAEKPVPQRVVLAVDGTTAIRNFMPTRMLPGYAFKSWSYKGGVLRMTFRAKTGSTIVWTVAPMPGGSCDRGKDGSFQLAGNKVWWAEDGASQRAWRCVFGQDGKALRLTASSTTPPTKLAGVGLGRVVASGKRY